MADPLEVIVGDIQTASQLRVAFTLLRDVDPAVLKAARDRIGTAEAVVVVTYAETQEAVNDGDFQTIEIEFT